jgi:chemotaxis protein MotB
MAKGRGKDKGSIVLRKEEIIEGGHHGGAWKVAYADFVTAMMAFFLLMWLLNATTEEQRKGLADYFSPKNPISRGSSGTGAPFGGSTPYDHGSLTSNRGAVSALAGNAPPEDEPEEQSDTPTEVRPKNQADSSTAAPAGDNPDAASSGSGPAQQGRGGAGAVPDASQQAAAAVAAAMQQAAVAESREAAEQREREAFKQAADQIREAIRKDPNLADLARQLAIDITPDGLRIQIMDEDKQPMFATGSAALNDRARQLLQKVAPVLLKLSEPVSISGHTDATPYRGNDRTNWELSAERANATRRLLVDAGLPEARLRAVTGNADKDPLLPADPFAAANRRIAITVLRSVPSAPAQASTPPAAPAPRVKAQLVPSVPKRS